MSYGRRGIKLLFLCIINSYKVKNVDKIIFIAILQMIFVTSKFAFHKILLIAVKSEQRIIILTKKVSYGIL